MWPRKQLDIGWRDFFYGLRCVLSPKSPPDDEEVVAADWISPREALVTLSVRTGWDLFLTTLNLPPGSEILVSGVTIPDMVRIIEHHGLVAVPVAVDADRLEPSLDELERAITPRTRAILVAHLFGARIDMEPIIRMARQHDLLVVEDCAQAFVGREYAGHDESDCSLFSFGPIKTATALGSAVLRIRDAAVRTQMAELHQSYPVQSHRAYLSRLAKYASFRVLCWPWVYGVLVRAYRLCGADYDRKFGNAAHSFPGAEFFQQIRRQPCSALVRVLQHRLATFDSRGGPRLRRRTARGNQLVDLLPPGMVVGGQNETHTYWVMPLRVANTDEVLAALQRAGFDATSRSSLIVVGAPKQSSSDQPRSAPWLAETIFLPNGHDIPDSEWKRASLILGDVATVAADSGSTEPSDSFRVPVPS
ncbi:MAG: aminotransferase class V-fold PLP-dependent enzyme [Planctomycetes bacterium]|nr:aminotransferase class V-fold PLP-dependent enzyme [Planctomycetota bacterium]